MHLAPPRAGGGAPALDVLAESLQVVLDAVADDAGPLAHGLRDALRFDVELSGDPGVPGVQAVEGDHPGLPRTVDRGPRDAFVRYLLGNPGVELPGLSADLHTPVRQVVADLPDLLDARHELRELRELGPLVVRGAHRYGHLDRLGHAAHELLLSVPAPWLPGGFEGKRRGTGSGWTRWMTWPSPVPPRGPRCRRRCRSPTSPSGCRRSSRRKRSPSTTRWWPARRRCAVPGRTPSPGSASRCQGSRVAELTVVVSAHDRREWLRRCLTALALLPERPAVVVVDNGSNDGTSGMVAHEYPQVRLLRRQRNAMAEVRNAGVAAASTPFVALADVDTGWVPGALERAVHLMRE